MTDYLALADSLRTAFNRNDIDWDDIAAAERALRDFAAPGDKAATDYIAMARECGAWPAHAGAVTITETDLATFAARIAQAAPEDPAQPVGRARGGHARAAALTPERRSEIARIAGAARWAALAAPAEPAEPAAPVKKEWSFAELLNAIHGYRCEHFQNEDGGMPLVDALATAFGDSDIGRAKEELESLADHICDEMYPVEAEPAQDREDALRLEWFLRNRSDMPKTIEAWRAAVDAARQAPKEPT